MQEKLLEIIKEAGELFKDGFYSSKELTFKAKKDLVTQYDVAVEEFLKQKFKKEFPTFNIIAEESDNSSVVFGDSIIIDPIDGTTNFVNKLPHTAISVGVYKNKKPFIGIVYNPILDQLYSAQVNKGAFLNGKKIKVSNEKDFSKALISTGFPYTCSSNKEDLNDIINKLKKVLPLCQDIRRLGAASLDICYVASGIYEGYYEMNLKAWDVSAGLIILSEAGGWFSSLQNKEYDLFNSKYIVASNKKIHKELLFNLK